MQVQDRLDVAQAAEVATSPDPGALATLDEDTRAGVVLAMQRTCGNQVVARMLSAPEGVYRGKGKVAKGVIGWIVTVGERKLVKRAAIYTEKEMGKLLSKGYNILVRDGEHVAKRVAKKVWDDYIHHTGHLIRKTGKYGLSHYQPMRQVIGRAGEKGWHIFYTALPVLFFSEDAEAMAIYEDQYPGRTAARYLTVTHYVGEDSWLSYLDWINPGELIAIGGDIGRDWDRERTKELKALVFNRQLADGTRQSYEVDPEGKLVRVIAVSSTGVRKEMTAVEFYDFLGKHAAPNYEAPAEDGTKHENYQSTFDAEYRIYNSKRSWQYDGKTAALFLPADDAKKLVRVGDFWVMVEERIDYVYAYAHPRFRPALRQPGFKIPEDLVEDYLDAPDKATFLAQWLETVLAGAALRDATEKLRVPVATGPERRVPIASGPERRVPIASGGSEQRVPIATGGGPD